MPLILTKIKYITPTLSLIFAISFPVKTMAAYPFDTVRVRILSKFNLKKIEIFVKEGRLYLGEQTITLKNKNLSIEIDGKKILLSLPGKRYTDNFAGISSDKIIEIKFSRRKKVPSRFYISP